MKNWIIAFFIIGTLQLVAQNNVEIERFKIVTFNHEGTITTSKIETITSKERVDINFYRKHFFKPHGYPESFVNTAYKDTIITVWRDSLNEKTFQDNWSYKIVYDSLSRAIRYSYSGCFICSAWPYDISVFYDTQNRPIRLEERLGKKIPCTEIDEYNREVVNEFILKYNENGEVIQLQHLHNGILESQIDKLTD